jgi:hypothetical protein
LQDNALEELKQDSAVAKLRAGCRDFEDLELDSDHCPMLSMPDELVRVVKNFAQRFVEGPHSA